MNKLLLKHAARNSLGVVAYVFLIASFFRLMEKFLSNKPDIFFAPVTMLLLLVTSAAITGYLIVGKPIMLFIEGKKVEAVNQFGYTITFMVFFTVLAIIANFLIS